MLKSNTFREIFRNFVSTDGLFIINMALPQVNEYLNCMKTFKITKNKQKKINLKTKFELLGFERVTTLPVNTIFLCRIFYICGVLRNLVPFVHFKKGEEHP